MEQTSDQPNPTPEQQVEIFENLLTQYDHQPPQQGQVLQATIIQKDKDGILVDIGIKRDALIPARDLSKIDPAYLDQLSPGTLVPVFVLGQSEESGELQLSLSRGLEDQLWEKAEKYMQEKTTLELDVLGHNRGGLIIRFESLRGFLPFSLVPDLQGVRSPKRADAIKNGLVGKALPVKITEVDRSRNRLILSAEAAQKEILQKRFEEIKKGQVVTGKVVKILDFGAFVDLGAVDGLVHITQLAWKKPNHPSEVVKLGDEIEVKIIDVDVERQRISLSRKAMLPGPWQTIGEELKAGDYVEGAVTRLVDFGAFVKLPMGVEGLIHTSQIGYSSSQNQQGAIKPGDRVLLKVLEVNSERKRVALSMRQVPMERQIAWAMGNLEREEAPAPKQDLHPDATPEPKPEPQPEAEPAAALESEPETLPEAEPAAALESEPETQPEAEPAAALESEPETQPAAEPAAALESEPETQPEAEPAAALESEPETQPEAEPAAALEPESHLMVEPGSTAETEPEQETEPVSAEQAQPEQPPEDQVQPEQSPQDSSSEEN
jgi:small subunit ribosomal protein S1